LAVRLIAYFFFSAGIPRVAAFLSPGKLSFQLAAISYVIEATALFLERQHGTANMDQTKGTIAVCCTCNIPLIPSSDHPCVMPTLPQF
jgi:hypothetical protein